MDSKPTKWFYLQPFLSTRESLHLLDISRRLKTNHATVRKYLNEFAKDGFLKISSKGRLTLYEVNFDFPLVFDYLSIAEKEFLLYKCAQNKVFREIVYYLQKASSKPVIVFGSSAENFSKAQDVDIVCLEDIDFTEIDKKYSKKVHGLKVASLISIKESLKKEILKKHIILNSVEEVVKWLA
ncbi:MAG: hypothetical protein V1659_04690 [Candidatus Woesearchaeota archaeon]